AESARQIPNKGDLRDYWKQISFAGDFLGTTSSYSVIRDPILRLRHRLIACSIAGRSQAPEKVIVTDLSYLRGMDVGSVNVPYLFAKYLGLFIAGRKGGAYISDGQFVARSAEHFGLLTTKILQGLTVISPELQIIDMVELPPPPPVAARTMPQRLGRLKEEMQGLRRNVGSLRELVERSITDQGRFSTWMISCMAQLMEASGLTYQAFDGTFQGSSPAAF
nr:hypothetical protein [Tanacetum cinerariifolium]